MKLELGQTYICTKSINDNWWTVGKEYFVVLNYFNKPSLVDNDGDKWEANMIKDCEIKFKLKENIYELKAEITYWRETAIYWRDKYEEAESELQHQKETAYHLKENYLLS